MAKKKQYPGTKEAERQKSLRKYEPDDEPDFVAPCVPNYEKFERLGWSTEKTLVWLNID